MNKANSKILKPALSRKNKENVPPPNVFDVDPYDEQQGTVKESSLQRLQSGRLKEVSGRLQSSKVSKLALFNSVSHALPKLRAPELVVDTQKPLSSLQSVDVRVREDPTTKSVKVSSLHSLEPKETVVPKTRKSPELKIDLPPVHSCETAGPKNRKSPESRTELPLYSLDTALLPKTRKSPELRTLPAPERDRKEAPKHPKFSEMTISETSGRATEKPARKTSLEIKEDEEDEQPQRSRKSRTEGERKKLSSHLREYEEEVTERSRKSSEKRQSEESAHERNQKLRSFEADRQSRKLLSSEKLEVAVNERTRKSSESRPSETVVTEKSKKSSELKTSETDRNTRKLSSEGRETHHEAEKSKKSSELKPTETDRNTRKLSSEGRETHHEMGGHDRNQKSSETKTSHAAERAKKLSTEKMATVSQTHRISLEAEEPERTRKPSASSAASRGTKVGEQTIKPTSGRTSREGGTETTNEGILTIALKLKVGEIKSSWKNGKIGKAAETEQKVTVKAFGARQQVLTSKDMLEWIAQFLPGLELMRLLLSKKQTFNWFCDPNHRLWQALCRSAKKLRCLEREDYSWKRRYLQSLAICEACDHYNPKGPGAVVACVFCASQYCGFNPPLGHVRLPPSDTLLIRPVTTASSKVGMCYEKCWALCWRCNDLITQFSAGNAGPVCRSCRPPGGDVCEQCQEALVLAHYKPQWEARRQQRGLGRILGLDDSIFEIGSESEAPGAHDRIEYRRRGEESALDDSTIFDPYR